MIRSFQWDLARQVERLDWLLDQLPRYAEWGYQELHLHLEDAVDYPGLPGVARRDALSWRQFERLVGCADRHGIKTTPIVNLLGHTQYLIKTETWRDLNELRSDDGGPLPHGQLCPSDPRTLKVAGKLIRDLAPWATSGRIHVGLDESFHLGKHPASRRDIAAIGRPGYFARYVGQLQELVAAHGRETAIWADMLVLLPEAIERLPAGLVVYDWYYHAFRRHPRFELYNFAEYDLIPALRNRNLTHWACPMNGAFRHEPLPVFGERLANALSWWQRGRRTGAQGFLVSSWEPAHLTPELTTVIDAAIAGLWLEGDATDQATLLRRGFARVHGRARAAETARLALACDDRAFAGYARAELHHHWDATTGREGPARAAAEARFFQRSLRRRTPTPFHLSLRWRAYLAERDLFVKRCARQVLRARRLWARAKTADLHRQFDALEAATASFARDLDAGETAARELWQLTRRARQSNPNQQIIHQDRQRLHRWLMWLHHARRSPSHLLTASPLAGVWQLTMIIHHLRPAANMVVVQQQQENGSWIDLRRRHTIEFRSAGARRQSLIQRSWSVPVAQPDQPLRLALRGVGEVAISHVELTDGITTRTNRAWRVATRRRLGGPAPTSGWIDLDWNQNIATQDLRF